MDTQASTSSEAILPERKQFLQLLLSNPNHFGTIDKSPLAPIKKMSSDTTYEQLGCIGFNPQLNMLEGIVAIKKSSGFNGGVCTSGSQEYVSFFLSYDNGTTWIAQGTTNFTVYDVPGPHPLEYAVSVLIQPDRKFCFVSNLPLVRAILSWSVPAVDANTIPVWGNIVQTRIQIESLKLLVDFPDVLKAANLSIPLELSDIVAKSATVKLAAPLALSAAELAKAYAGTSVPAHRYLHPTLQNAVQHPAKLPLVSAKLSSLGVDTAAVVAAAASTSGSTEYEQLGCVGLDEGTGLSGTLVGTLSIKLPSGYLGTPCSAGSKEYVAFWIDWGSGWQWVGTSSVNVFDIADIPKEGLNYAVYQPVDINSHRKPCADGPVTAKVRAILSWETPPPSTNPNYVPVWGNQLDAIVLIDPGISNSVGDLTPFITSICDVQVCDINQSSGFAYPGVGDHPFGATVSIFGSIPGAPLFSSPQTGQPKYQITVQAIDTATNSLIPGTQQIVTDPFSLTVVQNLGGSITSFTLPQNAVQGYFTYQATNPSALGWTIITPQGLLGAWDTGNKTGTWQISVTAWNDSLTTKYVAGVIHCSDGTSRQSIVIDLDQAAPVLTNSPGFQITGYQAGGSGPVINAVNCQTFTVGDIIHGSYSVTDEHLGSFSLTAEPTTAPNEGFTIDGVSGNSLSYPNPALPLSGTKSGTWTYTTGGLPPCGYTIELFAVDRTVVNCINEGWPTSAYVGFCLVAPPK